MMDKKLNLKGVGDTICVLIEGVFIGLSAIRANKMRSLLTLLGVIIGVASVLLRCV